MEVKVKREIAVKDYAGPGNHLYKDQLGWTNCDKEEAHSLVSKDVWDYQVCLIGLNIAFYYPGNDTFYGLHTEMWPHVFYELNRDRNKGESICEQCTKDTHDGGKPLYSFENIYDAWDTIKIDGKSLEEVLDASYIVMLS